MNTLLALLLIAPPNQVSLRVDGAGYLRFLRDGRIVYAKEATLEAKGGKLASILGPSLFPSVTASTSDELSVSEDGTITVSNRIVGKVYLAQFTSESELTPSNGFLVASTRPTLAEAGQTGVGKIVSGTAVKAAVVSSTTTKPAVNPRSTPVPSEPRATTSKIKIVFESKVTISGNDFTLLDLVDANSPASLKDVFGKTIFGQTPPVGVTQRISRERIVARLNLVMPSWRDHDISIPNTVEVVRKGKQVTHLDFIQEGVRSVIEALGVPVELSCAEKGVDLSVPDGEVKLKSESVQFSGGQARVTVAIFVDGKRWNSRTLSLSGSALEHSVRAGTIVKVRIVSGGAVAMLDGRAKSTASIGQAVEVEVTVGDSKSSLFGTLKSPGLVEVKM